MRLLIHLFIFFKVFCFIIITNDGHESMPLVPRG